MIKGCVSGQALTLDKSIIVSDTIDYITAQFTFSADWAGAAKFAHFTQGETSLIVMLTEDQIRQEDHLNLSAGEWDVYLHGNIADRRITTQIRRIRVQETGVLSGEPLPDMPLPVAEQIAAKAQDAKDTADRAEAKADEALEIAGQTKPWADAAEAAAKRAETAADSADQSAADAASSASASDAAANSARSDAERASDAQAKAETAAASAGSSASDAAASKAEAGKSAQDASGSAVLAESWARGGTGTRPGEDADNAEYWAGQAKEAAQAPKDHESLTGRDKPGQHPIDAIDGLTAALQSKVNKSDVSQRLDNDPKKIPSNAAIWQELSRAEYRNMIVTVEQVYTGDFYASSTAAEIRDFSNAGGTVSLQYQEQIYDYQGYKNGVAVFYRATIDAETAEGLEIAVDHTRLVTVTRKGFEGGVKIDDAANNRTTTLSSRESANRFANAIKRNVSGSVVAVDDVDPIQHDIDCNVIVNLAKPEGWTHTGIVSDEGTIQTYLNRAFSGFIKTQSEMSFNVNKLWNKRSAYINRILEYDFEKKFIRRFDPAGTPEKLDYTPHKNVEYVVVDILDYDATELDLEEVKENVQVNYAFLPVPFTPYTDLSALTVWRYGGNVLRIFQNESQNPTYRFRVVYDSDKGDISITSLVDYQAYFNLPFPAVLGTWEFSSSENVIIPIEIKKNKGYFDVGLEKGRKTRVINFTEYGDYEISTIIPAKATVSFKGLCISKKGFVPYVPPVEYTPDTSGKISGMESIADSNDMTLLSSAGGAAIINAQYNRDSNIVVQRLSERLAALEAAATNI